MEINVGDYVRDKNGRVGKVFDITNEPSVDVGIGIISEVNAVWFKKSGTGKMNSKCKKNFFIHSTGSSKYHPTEKNHKLLEELILDNTNENDLIIDTCMGSGSTGIVAVKNNRNFIEIELDETYFNIAKERIEKEV